jgi:hypothetical protein
MKTKFIYVVLMALFLGSQMTLSAQNEENKERKQRPTPEQMMQMQTNQMVRALMLSLSLAVLSGFVTLSRFLSFSTVKLFSEFIHIALFLLINPYP